MTTITIVVDASSLQRTASGSIVGKVSLRGEAAAFPEEDWFDFPVVLLGCWVDGLTKLASGKTANFRGLFMDGPYAFTARAVADGFTEVSWGTRDSEAPVGVMPIRELHKAAFEAGTTVARECQTRRWQCADVQNLEDALARAAV